MVPLQFFRNRDFTGSAAVIAIMFFAGPATFFFLSQFFQLIQGRNPFEAGLLILPNAGAIVLASIIAASPHQPARPEACRDGLDLHHGGRRGHLHAVSQADWSATREIAVIMMFGFGFGLGMPTLTDSIMASVPVEDAGVGSAVNDVSRELGSALGIAVLGSFIGGIYRRNVSDALSGHADGEVVRLAKEGLGVLAGRGLPSDQPALATASRAFVHAMNSGFWLSAAVLAGGAVIAAAMLPNRARAIQVERDEADDFDRPTAEVHEPGLIPIPIN